MSCHVISCRYASHRQPSVLRKQRTSVTPPKTTRARSASPARTKTTTTTATATSTSASTSTPNSTFTPSVPQHMSTSSSSTTTTPQPIGRTLASITADIKQERIQYKGQSYIMVPVYKYPRTWTQYDIDALTTAMDMELRTRLQSIMTTNHYQVSHIVTYALTQSTTSYGACVENLTLYMTWPTYLRNKYYKYYTVAWLNEVQPMLRQYLESVEGTGRRNRSYKKMNEDEVGRR